MKRGKLGTIAKLTKDELVVLIDNSESIADAIRKLGLSHWNNYGTLKRKCLREGVDITPLKERGKAYSRSRIADHVFKQKYSLDQILVENSPYKARGAVKQRLIKEGILEEKCKICGRDPEWMGKTLVLVLDHINGTNDDYRLENLRLLCPNCNSQTDTFAGRRIILCDECGSQTKRSTPSGLCRSCSGKRTSEISISKSKCPPKEELVFLRSGMGREEVGELFGVTGAAVKNWEKRYDLLGTLPDGRSFKRQKTA